MSMSPPLMKIKAYQYGEVDPLTLTASFSEIYIVCGSYYMGKKQYLKIVFVFYIQQAKNS